ncbi:MAG: C2 domain-containing protein [Myxococcota bacterium]|nr:C2 domain-containing protein [Myxococcota bacterium]
MMKQRVFAAIAVGLMCSLMSMGCGSKKPKGTTADGAEADGGLGEDGKEAEADTGPVTYPEPPTANAADRNPIKFSVSLSKAYVLPLSEDGRCWDRCTPEAKETMVDALTSLSGDQFASAGKALATALSAKGAKDALPDLYVYIDCGFGQTLTTSKSSAEDRIVTTWRGAKETLKLDPNDYCAVSVWDADDDDNDELIGDATVQLLKATKTGEVILTGADADFGQVFMVQLFLDQQEGDSIWQTDPSGSETDPSGSETTPSGETTPSIPSEPGKTAYKIEVVKANFKDKKDNGKPWDTKVPFLGGGGTLPDPFVAAYVNGYQSEHPFMETSSTQDKTYSEWREVGVVNLKNSDKIHFMVWDKDKVDHDLMGECISDKVGNLRLGTEISIRNCSQVDFLVFKITKR